MLDFCFILVASITVTWEILLSGNRFKSEAKAFISHILQRNFPNFGMKILPLSSAKSLRVFLEFLILLSRGICLSKVWLKHSQNRYIHFFLVLFYFSKTSNLTNKASLVLFFFLGTAYYFQNLKLVNQ